MAIPFCHGLAGSIHIEYGFSGVKSEKAKKSHSIGTFRLDALYFFCISCINLQNNEYQAL